MARHKKHHINLTDDEVKTLKKIIRDKTTCKTVLKRCQILLELDENRGKVLTHKQIAHSYAVCLSTVANVVHAYAENGISKIIRHNKNPNTGASLRKVDGRAEARIIKIACSEAPEGHSRWTLRLLEEQARIELETPVSRETIRRVLKKTNFTPIKTTTGAYRQRKTRNS